MSPDPTPGRRFWQPVLRADEKVLWAGRPLAAEYQAGSARTLVGGAVLTLIARGFVWAFARGHFAALRGVAWHRAHWVSLSGALADGRLLVLNVSDQAKHKRGLEVQTALHVRGRLGGHADAVWPANIRALQLSPRLTAGGRTEVCFAGRYDSFAVFQSDFAALVALPGAAVMPGAAAG